MNPGGIETASRHWRDSLAAWAIPEEILLAAPESPWGFPPELFEASARSALEAHSSTPSRRHALDALGGGGTVLDVGCGAGAASLPLAPPATRITAVDESEEMLRVFSGLARPRSVDLEPVVGRWPDICGQVAVADLVVCHHVVYNVPDVVSFVDELDRHARRRVVMELTESHPQTELNLLWRELHGIERPSGPRVEDLVEVVTEMGIVPHLRRFRQPSPWGAEREARVAFTRRRLCVGAEHDAEIDRLLTDAGRELATLWWDHDGGPAAAR